jgi:acetate kinase
MGIVLDKENNERKEKGILEIQATRSPVKILVVPTDEERAIAIETTRIVSKIPGN